MARDTSLSKSLRAGLRSVGKLDGWDMKKRPVQKGYAVDQVVMHCVQNPKWQRLRKSLKGLETSQKLAQLEQWWDKQMRQAQIYLQEEDASWKRMGHSLKWATEVQVGNYLGALRRGGQLNDSNQVRKVY